MLNKVKCPICGIEFVKIHECDPNSGTLFTYWFNQKRNVLQLTKTSKAAPFTILDHTEINL